MWAQATLAAASATSQPEPMFGFPGIPGTPNGIAIKGDTTMGSKIDDAKGRAKEAAGDLTDDDDLKREGKVDQAGAKVKDVVDDVKGRVEDAVDQVKDKVTKH